jgi:hypothetical protein
MLLTIYHNTIKNYYNGSNVAFAYKLKIELSYFIMREKLVGTSKQYKNQTTASYVPYQ